MDTGGGVNEVDGAGKTTFFRWDRPRSVLMNNYILSRLRITRFPIIAQHWSLGITPGFSVYRSWRAPLGCYARTRNRERIDERSPVPFPTRSYRSALGANDKGAWSPVLPTEILITILS